MILLKYNTMSYVDLDKMSFMSSFSLLLNEIKLERMHICSSKPNMAGVKRWVLHFVLCWGPFVPVLGTARTLAALPHPTHLLYRISTLIVTPLPITHVIPYTTVPCPCAWPDAQKWLESKDRARSHWHHVLMSLKAWWQRNNNHFYLSPKICTHLKKINM